MVVNMVLMRCRRRGRAGMVFNADRDGDQTPGPGGDAPADSRVCEIDTVVVGGGDWGPWGESG